MLGAAAEATPADWAPPLPAAPPRGCEGDGEAGDRALALLVLTPLVLLLLLLMPVPGPAVPVRQGAVGVSAMAAELLLPPLPLLAAGALARGGVKVGEPAAEAAAAEGTPVREWAEAEAGGVVLGLAPTLRLALGVLLWVGVGVLVLDEVGLPVEEEVGVGGGEALLD
jgi:hypothetical protein